jgi:outer membrane protein OmpA-like peptidoglycan-associated protein
MLLRPMKRANLILYAVVLLCATSAQANPSKSGSTGLIKSPTADTLDSGNICIGVWCDASSNATNSPLIMPISLTMGIGSFWEVYGAYPNVLLNNQEESSLDGTAQIGMKLRFGLKRSDPMKFAVDAFVRRHLSLDTGYDGVSDVGGRLIYSLKSDQLGAHLYGGYVRNGQPSSSSMTLNPIPIENQVLFGGGLEYMFGQRTKFTFEATGNTARYSGGDVEVEALAGFQYYLSPHLTFNFAGGRGINDAGADWRMIVGFSTCQGIGTYIKPVPQLVKEREAKKTEVARPTKVIPLSPLMVKAPSATAVSKLEVPIDPDQEEVIIKAYGQVALAPQLATAPVVLKQRINLEVPGSSAESVASAPANVASGLESKALEYTLAKMSGSTPLYGVVYQEDKLTPDTVKSLRPPETMTVYRKFRFPDIIFEFSSSTLSKEVLKSLSEVAEIVRKDNRWRYLRIDGHTDNVGSVKHNMELSLRRSIAVANYLITREGLDPSKIFVKGLGKSRPVADNETAEGRAQNRRFEILFLVNK